MFNIVNKSIEWGGKTLEIETGKVARQAQGSVIVTYGGVKVLAAVCYASKSDPTLDFFPLTVTYQEKTTAAGKIPGGFFKREGRPSEHETLTSRLIDRPIRPMFEDGFKAETQVVLTVIQHDQKVQSDIVALVAASAALAISGAPFNGPIAGCRVGYTDGEYTLNPDHGFEEDTKLDIIIAGTKSSVLMVESQAQELTEEEMLGSVKFAHDSMQPVIDMIQELADEAGKERITVEKADLSDLEKKIAKISTKAVTQAYKSTDKQERTTALDVAKTELKEALLADLGEEGYAENESHIGALYKDLQSKIVRGDVLGGKRIDGRKLNQVRPIIAETEFLPLTHGSALFTRGETQSIVTIALGSEQEEQRFDSLLGEQKSHFMLHYNFPPYSVGEARRMGPPGRREIGHGKLAHRAITPLMPSKADFPYTIRVVSEITESNGSSSMATVCGTSLALMDAGVPIAKPCAGIAMGLVLEGKDFAVLSDILGDEDHLGDMDFKVAGTKDGITSLQMDIKVQGITQEIMKEALEQAKEGREHILGEMAKAITEPNAKLKPSVPQAYEMKINKGKIRDLIGPGGVNIKDIVAKSGCKVDVNDNGKVTIMAAGEEAFEYAKQLVNEVAGDVEKGTVFNDCKVIKILDFGVVVQFMGKQQGLVHISEIAEERVNDVNEHFKMGDIVTAKVIDVDKQGKIKLSTKGLLGSSEEAA